MKAIVLLTLALPLASFSSENSLLLLRREKPFIQCDVSKSQVKIVRKTQGVKFSKVVSYEMDDLSPLIEDAFVSLQTNDAGAEHFAINNKNESFPLAGTDPKSLKLIRLISELCEVRSL